MSRYAHSGQSLADLLCLKTDNPSFPYGGFTLGLRPADERGSLGGDILELASKDSCVPAGTVSFVVTDEAEELIEGYRFGNAGLVIPAHYYLASFHWGSCVALAGALGDALGVDWEAEPSYPNMWDELPPWQETLGAKLAGDIRRMLAIYRHMHNCRMSPDSGMMRVACVHLNEVAWARVQPGGEWTGQVDALRTRIAAGALIAWAI